MENNRSYKTYIESLKKQCIISSVGSFAGLITIVLLVFIPFLAFKIEDLTVFNLSLFDGIKQAFTMFDATEASVFSIFGIYQIIAVVYFIIAMVMLIIDISKGLGNVLNVDSYALQTYDKFKKRVEETKHRRKRGGVLTYFIGAIIMEMLYIFIGGIFQKLVSSSDAPDEIMQNMPDYMLVNGVEGTIAIPIIFAVIALALMLYSKKMLNDIKTQIIREDYEEEF